MQTASDRIRALDARHPAISARCQRCVLDSSVPDLTLVDGVCQYCREWGTHVGHTIELSEEKLQSLVRKIRSDGAGKKFDCLMGLSGGVDSSYVLMKAVDFGIRPLVIHLDNGWNTAESNHNISVLVDQLNVPLITNVLEWEMFSDVQLSMLKASVPDGEAPTDHAIYATMLHEVRRHEISSVISGGNYATESILPSEWAYGGADWRYISGIHRRFGSSDLAKFPQYGLLDLSRIRLSGPPTIRLLNYMPYDRQQAIDELVARVGWVDYGGKHCESSYTRFFQTVLLPHKFNIDKRKAHLSSEILAGAVTREEALVALDRPTFDDGWLDAELPFILAKLRISDAEFWDIIDTPPKTFRDYPNQHERVQRIQTVRYFPSTVVRRIRKLGSAATK
jgi:N-acetyl sugar amidotransferase